MTEVARIKLATPSDGTILTPAAYSHNRAQSTERYVASAVCSFSRALPGKS